MYVTHRRVWLLFFLIPSDVSSFHSIVICIESCLFGTFVVSVLVDQIQSIVNDRSLIDALKSDDNARMASPANSSRRILFRKVFGSGTALFIVRCRAVRIACFFLGPIILWLLPCDLKSANQTSDSQDMYHV